MASKILLFVSSAQSLLGVWRNGTLERCEILPAGDDGHALFSGLLKVTPRAPVYVVADTVEEDYRFETLPHATGSDRGSLIERKMRQYYRNTRFVSALWRGQIGEQRRDDQYLFSALTNPGLVDTWLGIAAEHGAPVAGVYLAPTLSGGLLAKLKAAWPRVLLVAPHRAGLRLTFYKGGEFCSSRLTRALPAVAQDAVRMLTTELSNTRLSLVDAATGYAR
ncbi:MAG: hypothetical protein FJY56_09135 [Betaproteobacteria bacterium]|nr:hypothetical protein [Betaproteobacteria bacterium]